MPISPAPDDPRNVRGLLVELAAARDRIQQLEAEVDRRGDDFRSEQLRWAAGNLQFAAAMVQTLDARDSYTAGHSAAVAVYTADIARTLGMSQEYMQRAHLAGLLHDIGKIGVRDEVLNKTGKLEPHEFEEIKAHSVIGADVLAMIDAYSDLSSVVRHHHERIDGNGYPDGLSGDSIPLVSRIIAVADTYSALTTDRPYREGMPPERAMQILQEAVDEGQLDAECTTQFLGVLEFSSIDYQRGRLESFQVAAAQHHALDSTGVFVAPSTPSERSDRGWIELPVAPGVVLRSLDVSDAEGYFRALDRNRASLMEWLETFVAPVVSVDYTRDMIRRYHDRRIANTEVSLGVFVDDAFAGEVCIQYLDTDEPMLGYWLIPEYRGRGIATRSVQRMTTWAFSKLGIERIFADPYLLNAASIRIPEQLGFDFVRIEPRAECIDGTWHDLRIYGMDAAEWFRREAAAVEAEAA